MKICDRVYVVGSGDFGLSHHYDCNVYLLDCGEQMALFDAGVGLVSDKIIDNIVDEGKDPAKVTHLFITHSHPDHAGGAYEIADKLGCSVYAAFLEGSIISNGTNEQIGLLEDRDANYLPGYKFKHVQTVEIKDMEKVEVGDLYVQAIFTPGHSICSTCYYFTFGDKRCLCSGDTVFIKGLVAIYNSFGFDMGKYSKSLQKLSNLRIDALLPGHLGFTIYNGQACIDHAVEQFKKIDLPKSIGLLG